MEVHSLNRLKSPERQLGYLREWSWHAHHTPDGAAAIVSEVFDHFDIRRQQDRDAIIHQVERNAHAADRVQAHAAGRIRMRDHLLRQGVRRDIPAWRKAQELWWQKT